MKIYVRNRDYSNILDELSENELENLMLKCKISKKQERYAKYILSLKRWKKKSKKYFKN